jgi:hypothetical protein
MMTVLPTKYKEYLFRSRTEARWAVFFDQLNIPFEYEKEGYDLDGIWYLPDFWLPTLDCFIEIKGEYPSSEAQNKAQLLCINSHKNVYIFWGNPIGQFGGDERAISFSYYKHGEDSEACWDTAYRFTQCRYCGKFGITFNGFGDRIGCCVENIKSNSRNSEQKYIDKAVAIAKGWRF